MAKLQIEVLEDRTAPGCCGCCDCCANFIL